MSGSDYDRSIVETLRGIKSDFEGKNPRIDHSNVDGSVREAVNADLDTLIEKHEKRKPFPGIL